MGRILGRDVAVSILSAFFLTLMAGCGGASTSAGVTHAPRAAKSASKPAAPKSTSTLQPVKFQLGWLASGFDAPYAVAVKKHFYEQHGLKVTISEGKGTLNTLELVGDGKATFGEANFGAALEGLAKGVPVRAVSVWDQESPVGVIVLARSPIGKPADLRGRTLAAAPAGASTAQLNAFLASTGVPRSSIKFLAVRPADKDAALISGKVDGILGWSTLEVPALQARGVKVRILLFRNYGVNLMSDGVFASDKTIQSHPGLVRAFLSGTIEGWKYALKHPTAAASILSSEFPDVKPGVAKAQLIADGRLLHTAATKGKVIGYIARTDAQTSLNVLKKYHMVNTTRPISDFYTDTFLPTSGPS